MFAEKVKKKMMKMAMKREMEMPKGRRRIPWRRRRGARGGSGGLSRGRCRGTGQRGGSGIGARGGWRRMRRGTWRGCRGTARGTWGCASRASAAARGGTAAAPARTAPRRPSAPGTPAGGRTGALRRRPLRRKAAPSAASEAPTRQDRLSALLLWTSSLAKKKSLEKRESVWVGIMKELIFEIFSREKKLKEKLLFEGKKTCRVLLLN